jgi:plasmid stability protein
MASVSSRDDTTLTIPGVEPHVVENLRVRAARHGRSVEEEVRDILSQVSRDESPAEPNLAEAIRRRFAPFGGVELEPHPPVSVPPEAERAEARAAVQRLRARAEQLRLGRFDWAEWKAYRDEGRP